MCRFSVPSIWPSLFLTYFQYFSWFLKFWLIYITVFKYTFNFCLLISLCLCTQPFSLLLKILISAIVIIQVCSLVFGKEFFPKLADKQSYRLSAWHNWGSTWRKPLIVELSQMADWPRAIHMHHYYIIGVLLILLLLLSDVWRSGPPTVGNLSLGKWARASSEREVHKSQEASE